jgi:Trp operon repressor
MQKVNELLQKEMTRKEFLATLGFGAATVFGFSSILGFLTGKSNPFQQQQTMGYGNGAYGGDGRKNLNS